MRGVVALATCKGKDLTKDLGIPKTKKQYKTRKWLLKIKHIISKSK